MQAPRRELVSRAVAAVRRWLAQRDAVLMLALFITVVLLFGFVELAEAVGEGSVGFERSLMLALREPGAPNDPVGPRWFEQLWLDLTVLGNPDILALLGLIVLGYLAMLREWRTALVFAIALVGGGLGSTLLKHAFERARPEVITRLVEVASPSFPSGHSLMAAVVYPTLGAMLARLVQHVRLKLYLLGVSIVLMVLIGASRVYLGVHYPSDVLAGWMLGLGWATLCWTVLRALQRRRVVEPPGIPPEAGPKTSG